MTQTSAEPEKITVTRHRCPHCRRSWSRKAAAVAHISRCWFNPAAKSCKTCAFFTPAESGDYQTPGCDESCAAGVNLRQFDREDDPLSVRDLPVGCPEWSEAPR